MIEIDDSDLYGDLMELESGIADLDHEIARLTNIVTRFVEAFMMGFAEVLA